MSEFKIRDRKKGWERHRHRNRQKGCEIVRRFETESETDRKVVREREWKFLSSRLETERMIERGGEIDRKVERQLVSDKNV